MDEIREFLRNCGGFCIATMNGDQPRVRPFGIVEIFEDHLYIETGKKKDVYKQIMKNNKVELCGFQGEKWIRVTGKLINDDRVEAKKYVLDMNPHIRSMYDENDDNTAVLYFESGKATIYSFVEPPRTIEF